MFQRSFELLKKEAYKVNYDVNLISHLPSYCNHSDRTIGISKLMGEDNAIFEFAHELGHCYQYRKSYYTSRDNSKIIFITSEIDAWIRGFPILKRNNISTKGYLKHASFCVWLYVKYRILKRSV